MSNIVLPNFKIDPSTIPSAKIKSIAFHKFKAFEDVFFDFMDGDKCKNFICFHGPNGSGKTTILDAITLIFSRLEGRELKHLKALLGKSVRHVDGAQAAIYNDDDFLITAQIRSSIGDYEVQINKSGFIKDHPLEIKEIIYRLCYYARFDQELHQFQLNRQHWATFKDLFESITGFSIEEKEGVFDESNDPVQANILKQYVLGFWVHKPDETISHKECSAGERKIIKSFSTILNKEYMPSVACIDNAEMHVEAGRHIQLIESMKRCFPDSQIFATTHSYYISRNFGDRSQLYDLRMIKASNILKSQPWRLYLGDEIRDGLLKIKSMTMDEKMSKWMITQGENLLKSCYEDENIESLVASSERFLSNVASVFIKDIVSYYKKSKRQKG